MGECSHSHRVSPVMYDGQERGTAEEAAHSLDTATENARLPHRGIPGIAGPATHGGTVAECDGGLALVCCGEHEWG